jgi:hypothetical protein
LLQRQLIIPSVARRWNSGETEDEPVEAFLADVVATAICRKDV